jgi:hypothetical protein
MSKWTRPQALAALLAGTYAASCPIWTTTPAGNKATHTMITLGGRTALVALLCLAMSDTVGFEGLMAFMGLLFAVSPRVIGFAASTTLAWTAWSVGVVALVAGAADVQATAAQHRGRAVVTNP